MRRPHQLHAHPAAPGRGCSAANAPPSPEASELDTILSAWKVEGRPSPPGARGTLAAYDLLSWTTVHPALAAGCTVVAKPATETPLATAQVVQAYADAGLPPGVLNLVIGRGSPGPQCVR